MQLSVLFLTSATYFFLDANTFYRFLQRSETLVFQNSGMLLTSIVILAGCGTTSRIQPTPRMTKAPDVNAVDQMLRAEADVWLGTPHFLGGPSDAGIDYSALVQTMYRDVFSVDLPRTTTQQANIGKRVSFGELQAGDLIFYRIDGGTRHVGIYLSDDEFLHASKSEGVAIANLNLPYWQRRLWTIRRILDAPRNERSSRDGQANTHVRW